MPQENKNARGRRDEKRLKRKREQGEEHPNANKRQKSQEPEDLDVQFIGTDNAVPMAEGGEEEGGATERPFYGMLEDEEQEYFRRADELLERNDFPSDEERSLFLANVYREAEGKELKIACSQSCSRLMERLILLSTVEQKKKLFGKFSDNYPHLIQHRFASHCCETLFIQSAPVVTEELTADSNLKKVDVEKVVEVDVDTEGKEADEEELPSMEELFLATLDELEGQMTFLLTDRFASHTLRVLLVILSGRALEKASTRTLMQSKKKEKISITGLDTTPTELSLNKRAVPSSFQFAVDKIISDTIATMDTTFIQILATHPTGNPTLQLLLELELTNPNSKKGVNASEKTIISALLPDDITAEKSESQTFINGILYDAIGSRLLETICTFAPGKLFKQIYRTIFKDRIAAVARNEISSYVAIRVLNRLSKEDLEEAVEAMIPQIEDLVKRHRTVILKTLLERCQARGADTKGLVDAIAASYDPKTSNVLLKMSCIDDIATLLTSTQPTEESSTAAPPPKPSSSQLHGSLLAQSMLTIPGPPALLIQDSLLSLPPQILLALSIYTTTSHTIQAALLPTLSNTIPFRRKLVNTLLFPPGEDENSNMSPTLTLALSNTGSHVLDALLTSTAAPTSLTTLSTPLFSVTERIATILLGCEPQLRDSWTGRIVLRNWSLDLFKRRRGDWVKKTKESALDTMRALPSSSLTPDTQPQPDENEDDEAEVKLPKISAPGMGKKNRKDRNKAKRAAKEEAKGPQKSAIQLAREKFAKGKLEKNNPSSSGKGKDFRTGANATKPVSA
ncbi:related to Nucleolar protein 9 [Rhynchosporium secalis]|uniref:Nucleolar protein 9 n=1 Tax=Rhynchosporium secalis TaxID=38038 RepID=A0A1E1M047_RHYSE|nr:related to Nucleolar protein 9 [Rhynchosporium secalis]